MEEPPGTPPIKAEPQEEAKFALPFGEHEVISLISDDEEAAPERSIVSPSHGQSRPVDTLDLGTSMFSSKPSKSTPAKPVLSENLQAMLRRARINAANQFRRQPNEARPSTPPEVGRSTETPGIFVTDSRPGTPNAAEVFRALQQDFDDLKRRNGTLTVEQEIKLQRATDAERARVLKEQMDNAFDEEHSVAIEESLRLSPDIASLPDDVPPRKQGRKRKAASTAAEQPKKRRAPRKSTEDILDIARRKREAKAKGKGSGKGKAKNPPKKQGRKQKATGPDLTNTANMLGGNVFEDAARMRDLPDQPTYQYDKRKDKVLKNLIASVPEEYRPIAKTDRKFLEDAMKDFTGRAAVRPADDGNWHVKGMKCTLKHYQILGVAAMRKRENSTTEPRGGILADSMGLGKTITMLANIVNGKSLQKHNCRTTLIVASAALVSQWRREIDQKVYTDKETKHGVGRVKEYHASAKLRSNQEVEELTDCEIVLTTYNQVQKSYPKAEIPAKYTTSDQKNAWWKRHFEEERGTLHKVKWFRVVLDESQSIKNHKSLTSVACRALDARHHWAISGTPLQNSIEEFYSLFKFIREPHGAGSMKLFRKNFCSDDDIYGLEKLGVFLRKFMIRRTHLDTLFSARLLDLPQPTENVILLDFNEIERNIYEIVKSRFIKRINCISKAGDLDKKYGHIWSMLLRLRQLTSHVLLVQDTLTDLLEREDFERLHKIASDDLSQESQALLAHLLQELKDNKQVPQIDTAVGATIVTETETVPNHRTQIDAGSHDTGGVHGLTYKFDRYLKDLLNSESWNDIASRTLCCSCRQPPLEPVVTSCFHVYCRSCLSDMQHSSARNSMECHRCSECGCYYTDVKPCEEPLKKFSGAYDNITGSAETEKLNASGQGRRGNKRDWLRMRGDILPSTKTIAVKAQIMSWIAEDPSAKIIVYSQWIPMLNLLGRICNTEGWPFEKYNGGMSHESRDNAIRNFGDPAKGKLILLASLKCGGLGLNLTMANRVISLDPWFNAAVEQQAFCRVYRIGQQHETRMARLCIKGTIDSAIHALQNDKQRVIDAAMDDSKRKEKLSIGDLMRLFGQVEEDDEGRPFIFAHGTDDDGNDDGRSSHFTPPPRAAEHTSDEEGDGLDDDF